MPKYAVAFVAPSEEKSLKHRIVEGTDVETALKAFFKEELAEYYSDNEQGYHYFREDFFDEGLTAGSIIALE
jgi:hypothetical protein